MAFTYTKVNFLNNESYNEIKHSQALASGWPNFVVSGFEYDKTTMTITNGRAMNGGLPVTLGREGETEVITNSGTKQFITLVTTLNGVSGSFSEIQMRAEYKVVDEAALKEFPLFEISVLDGTVVNDYRKSAIIGENKLVITSSGGLQSSINGERSNVVNLENLEFKKDFSFIYTTLADQANAIGVGGILTYNNLVEILDYHNTDSLTLTFSQAAEDPAYVLHPPKTNGELVIQRQFGTGGNLYIRYIESGRVGDTPHGNFIQKTNADADGEKQFDWKEFTRENSGLFDVIELEAGNTLNLEVERDRIYNLELTSLLATIQDIDIFTLKNFYNGTQYAFNYFNGIFRNNFGELRKISQEDVFDLTLNIVGFESLNISLQIETFNGKVRASGTMWGLSPKDQSKEIWGEFSFETKTVVTDFEFTAKTPLTARLITSEKGSY